MSQPRAFSVKATAIALLLTFSLAWAVFVLGVTALNIHNTDWLWGDLAVVYLAWVQYLSDPMAQGLLTQRMSYPLEMNVALFDPMPVFLLSAGKLAQWLPAGQYLGWYFVLCVLLQAVFGHLVMVELIKSRADLLGRKADIVKLLGAFFFVLTPFTINRFPGHPALSSQWILVASIWVSLRSRNTSTRQWLAWNGTLQFLASGINPYIAAMTGMSLSAMLLASPSNVTSAHRFGRLFTLATITVIGFYMFGFIGGASVQGGGYGSYSMNMLGPFDSNGGAMLFPLDIPDATGAQSFEGYNYLGLGTILLVASMLIARLTNKHAYGTLPALPIFTVVLSAYLLALSSTITFGSSTLHLPLPEMIESALNRFRASGRFFWMGALWLLAASIHLLVCRFRPRLSIALLGSLLMLQIADIAPIGTLTRNAIQNNKHLSITKLELESIPKQTKALIALPPRQCSIGRTPGGLRGYEFTGYAAAQLNIFTNSFYAARTLSEQRDYHCDLDRALANISSENTYFLHQPFYNKNRTLFDEEFHCRKSESILNAFICTPK